MMNTSEELYAKALKYRDNKVPECSPEESCVVAEMLFLELSQQGDVKAMHNYAVLQQKKGNYQLAADWFEKAGLDASKRNIKAMRACGQIKEDLYLVVANERSKVGSFGPFMDAVYGVEIDFSHRRSFGGIATTCDIKRCAIPDAKHITADVLTFDFAKKYNLKHVLIERLPTLNEIKPNLGFGGGPMLVDKEQHNDLETDAKVNYFGAVIQNLSRAMESGAILEIEWDPYSTQITQSPEQCEAYNAANPFHGFMSMEANFCGAQCADPYHKVYFPPELQDMAREYGKKFQQEVEFWHSQGAGASLSEICDRLKAEVELMIHLMNATVQDKNNGRKLAFVEGNILTDPTEKVIAALKNATYGNFDTRLAGKPVQMSDGRRGYLHDTCSLVPDSIYGIAIHSLCVQNNIPYAKHYLESIGFDDVVIERRTNTHNGRRNVWMVKAVKA